MQKCQAFSVQLSLSLMPIYIKLRLAHKPALVCHKYSIVANTESNTGRMIFALKRVLFCPMQTNREPTALKCMHDLQLPPVSQAQLDSLAEYIQVCYASCTCTRPSSQFSSEEQCPALVDVKALSSSQDRALTAPQSVLNFSMHSPHSPPFGTIIVKALDMHYIALALRLAPVKLCC